jgi:hypothetical protein
MSSESNVLPSVEIARLIAERGAATVERMHANVELAREMLASGKIAEPAAGVDPHFPAYPWESTEPRSDLPRRVWLADVLDFATGEGMTNHFAATLAHDEDEVRRRLSREVGRHLANDAKIKAGLGAFAPSRLFLSELLRSKLEAYERSEERPAVMSYFAKFSANYS